MEAGRRSLVWYLLAGTRGGPNRLRILEELRVRPRNAHQLAQLLGVDYRTVRHHLTLLERGGLIVCPLGKAYATPYELSPLLETEFESVAALRATGTSGGVGVKRSGRVPTSGASS